MLEACGRRAITWHVELCPHVRVTLQEREIARRAKLELEVTTSEELFHIHLQSVSRLQFMRTNGVIVARVRARDILKLFQLVGDLSSKRMILQRLNSRSEEVALLDPAVHHGGEVFQSERCMERCIAPHIPISKECFHVQAPRVL